MLAADRDGHLAVKPQLGLTDFTLLEQPLQNPLDDIVVVPTGRLPHLRIPKNSLIALMWFNVVDNFGRHGLSNRSAAQTMRVALLEGNRRSLPLSIVATTAGSTASFHDGNTGAKPGACEQERAIRQLPATRAT
jgi:hypothetical protein